MGYTFPLNLGVTFTCSETYAQAGPMVTLCHSHGLMELPFCMPTVETETKPCVVNVKDIAMNYLQVPEIYDEYFTRDKFEFPGKTVVVFECILEDQPKKSLNVSCHHGQMILPSCEYTQGDKEIINDAPDVEESGHTKDPRHKEPCVVNVKDIAMNYLQVPEIYDEYFTRDKFEFPGKTAVVFECVSGYHSKKSLNVPCRHGQMNLPFCEYTQEEGDPISTESPYSAEESGPTKDPRHKDVCKIMEHEMDSNNLVLPAMYYNLQTNRPKRDVLVPEDELISFQCLPGYIPNMPLHAVCSHGYMELPHCLLGSKIVSSMPSFPVHYKSRKLGPWMLYHPPSTALMDTVNGLVLTGQSIIFLIHRDAGANDHLTFCYENLPPWNIKVLQDGKVVWNLQKFDAADEGCFSIRVPHRGGLVQLTLFTKRMIIGKAKLVVPKKASLNDAPTFLKEGRCPFLSLPEDVLLWGDLDGIYRPGHTFWISCPSQNVVDVLRRKVTCKNNLQWETSWCRLIK
uniref:uncharacterized protein isoform X2 n=1 Tax=Myxine glutinosa TaxID=7769 RepID=UPI00358F1544